MLENRNVPDCGTGRASVFCETIRLPGEYIGYTNDHLPVRSCRPPEFKKEDANRAIFAARIAFSSF